MFSKSFFLACAMVLISSTAAADESSSPTTADSASTQSSGATGVQGLIEKGFSFLGVKYRFGGNGPESGGFDCSGLVRKVFGDALGLNLPRTASAMADMGDKVGRNELKPGDLVFFNTMRRTFSHVGIYIGDNQFLHAPSSGSVVRVDSIDNSYWVKRFTGGRRLVSEAQASMLSRDAGDLMADPVVIEALKKANIKQTGSSSSGDSALTADGSFTAGAGFFNPDQAAVSPSKNSSKALPSSAPQSPFSAASPSRMTPEMNPAHKSIAESFGNS